MGKTRREETKGTKCYVINCKSYKNKVTKSRGISFHKFPTHPLAKKAWEIAMRREGFEASKHSVLCSEHFRDEDFDRTGQTTRLRRETVVPSVFNFSQHLSKSQAPKKPKPNKPEPPKKRAPAKRGPGRPPKAAPAQQGPGRPPKGAPAKRGPGRPPKVSPAKQGQGRQPKGSLAKQGQGRQPKRAKRGIKTRSGCQLYGKTVPEEAVSVLLKEEQNEFEAWDEEIEDYEEFVPEEEDEEEEEDEYEVDDPLTVHPKQQQQQLKPLHKQPLVMLPPQSWPRVNLQRLQIPQSQLPPKTPHQNSSSTTATTSTTTSTTTTTTTTAKRVQKGGAHWKRLLPEDAVVTPPAAAPGGFPSRSLARVPDHFYCSYDNEVQAKLKTVEELLQYHRFKLNLLENANKSPTIQKLHIPEWPEYRRFVLEKKAECRIEVSVSNSDLTPNQTIPTSNATPIPKQTIPTSNATPIPNQTMPTSTATPIPNQTMPTSNGVPIWKQVMPGDFATPENKELLRQKYEELGEMRKKIKIQVQKRRRMVSKAKFVRYLVMVEPKGKKQGRSAKGMAEAIAKAVQGDAVKLHVEAEQEIMVEEEEDNEDEEEEMNGDEEEGTKEEKEKVMKDKMEKDEAEETGKEEQQKKKSEDEGESENEGEVKSIGMFKAGTTFVKVKKFKGKPIKVKKVVNKSKPIMIKKIPSLDKSVVSEAAEELMMGQHDYIDSDVLIEKDKQIKHLQRRLKYSKMREKRRKEQQDHLQEVVELLKEKCPEFSSGPMDPMLQRQCFLCHSPMLRRCHRVAQQWADVDVTQNQVSVTLSQLSSSVPRRVSLPRSLVSSGALGMVKAKRWRWRNGGSPLHPLCSDCRSLVQRNRMDTGRGRSCLFQSWRPYC